IDGESLHRIDELKMQLDIHIRIVYRSAGHFTEIEAQSAAVIMNFKCLTFKVGIGCFYTYLVQYMLLRLHHAVSLTDGRDDAVKHRVLALQRRFEVFRIVDPVTEPDEVKRQRVFMNGIRTVCQNRTESGRNLIRIFLPQHVIRTEQGIKIAPRLE